MVPASHPGCLLHEFTLFSTPDTTANMYTADANSKSQRMPFGNYLNFFGSAKGTTEANLSLIFEYLRVPSPFVGTDTILDPQTFAWNGGTPGEPSSTPAGVEPAGTAGLHPPFNMISNYRDPGKININTIAGSVDATGKASSNIWNALIGGDPSVSGNAAPGSTFTDVVVSRQGYAGSAYSLNPANPSIFSNPFRSAAGYDMTPLSSLTPKRPTNVTIFRTGMDASGHSTTDTVPGSGVPSDAGSAADNPFNVLPLMSNKPALTPQTQFPSKDTLPPYNDATRNPYFMYQGLGHLTNKITTRSNVFAVWITVGYFEVTPWYGTNTTTGAVNTAGAQVFDTAHPDGYQLGQELKADTGEIERHRSFYIIDRSIPVGFERGLDLNDDKTVILKRFIE